MNLISSVTSQELGQAEFKSKSEDTSDLDFDDLGTLVFVSERSWENEQLWKSYQDPVFIFNINWGLIVKNLSLFRKTNTMDTAWIRLTDWWSHDLFWLL